MNWYSCRPRLLQKSKPAACGFFFALALAFASTATAAPFLVADLADQTTTHCGYSIDGGTRAEVAVATLNSLKVCKVDLAGVVPGQHTASLTAVRNDPTWGRVESGPSVPFVFSVPAVPAVPANVRLVP